MLYTIRYLVPHLSEEQIEAEDEKDAVMMCTAPSFVESCTPVKEA